MGRIKRMAILSAQIFLGIALLVGTAIFSFGLISDQLQNRDLKTVTGKIIDGNYGFEYVGRARAPMRVWRAKYEYSVSGRMFSADQYSFGLGHFNSEDHAIGKSVTVYYEAKNPQNAALDPKKSFEDYAALIWSFLFFPLLTLIIIFVVIYKIFKLKNISVQKNQGLTKSFRNSK